MPGLSMLCRAASATVPRGIGAATTLSSSTIRTFRSAASTGIPSAGTLAAQSGVWLALPLEQNLLKLKSGHSQSQLSTISSRNGPVVGLLLPPSGSRRLHLDNTASKTGSKGMDIRERILADALQHVSAKGWTQDAIAHVVPKYGLSSASHGMFRHGGFDLVAHVLVEASEHSVAEVDRFLAETEIEVTLLDVLCHGLQERLKYIGREHQSTWAAAMALGATPANLSHTLTSLNDMVDEILFRAGDTTPEPASSIKKTALLGLYAAAEMHMLTDNSEDFRETCDFLKRRLHDAAGVWDTTLGGENHVLEAIFTGISSLAGLPASIVAVASDRTSAPPPPPPTRSF